MAHKRQSSPDFGLGFQVKVFKIFQVVSFSVRLTAHTAVLGAETAYTRRLLAQPLLSRFGGHFAQQLVRVGVHEPENLEKWVGWNSSSSLSSVCHLQ